MRFIRRFFERGIAIPTTLVAAAIIGFLTLIGLIVIPATTMPVADMRVEPAVKAVTTGNTFTIEVIVESSIPVNVFAGELKFNKDILAIESIDYNTSIADLWAELPWYSNGEGTLNFAGGTTQQDGFRGTDTLIIVTFKTLQEGEGVISMVDARILQHDGLGTDAELKDPRDALFMVEGGQAAEGNVVANAKSSTSYKVVKELPSTDLNGDGKQSLADVGIFMLNIAGGDMRYDLNLDGQVNTKDLSILLESS